MASGLRLTYMSKLDMHSVSLKVRDIQVFATFYGTGFGTCQITISESQ